MSKKVHFYHGCPWADGSIQMADTNQAYHWDKVTCLHCWDNKQADGTSSQWDEVDLERFVETLKWLEK